MTSSNHRPPPYRRRIIGLGIAVVLAVAAWTGAWFWLAGQATGSAMRAMEDARADGRELSCENVEARGYPFRLGLFCDAVAVRMPREGIVAGAGALRSAAQVYAPGHVVAELDGPAVLETPDILPLQLDWEQFRASLRHDMGQPERLSAESRNLKIALRQAGEDNAPLAAMHDGEVHARLNGPALDLAAALNGIALADPRYADIPEAELVMDATLPGGAALVDGTSPNGLTIRGQTVELKVLTLSLPARNASVSLSGNLVVGDDGLIDGSVDIRMTNPQAFADAAAVALPDTKDDLAPLVTGLTALGETGVPVTLTIRRGRVSAGLIPLGNLPPI